MTEKKEDSPLLIGKTPQDNHKDYLSMTDLSTLPPTLAVPGLGSQPQNVGQFTTQNPVFDPTMGTTGIVPIIGSDPIPTTTQAVIANANTTADPNSSGPDDYADQQALDVKEAGYQKGTNWDADNISTLNEWIVDCNKQQFIYDYVLDKILSKSKIVKILMLILCAVQSLISVSNLGVGDDTNVYMVWSFKIVLSVTSALSYILTQYMTLEKYEDIIKSYTSYTESLGNFLSDLTATSDIKPGLRPDGDKFILDHKDVYTNIFEKSPYMAQSDWTQAIAQYAIYLKNIDNGTDDYHGRKRNAYSRYVIDPATGQPSSRPTSPVANQTTTIPVTKPLTQPSTTTTPSTQTTGTKKITTRIGNVQMAMAMATPTATVIPMSVPVPVTNVLPIY